MEKTWRWFGKKDPITLSMLRQIGVEGIVTALHDKPNGETWQLDEVLLLKAHIENEGLRWSVVESLPVSESIKYGGGDRDALLDSYSKSIANLGKAGVKTVCYNFMPVIDWIRTDLRHQNADGTYSLYFDRVRFAYFDTKILKRSKAKNDYTDEEMRRVNALHKIITQKEKDELIDSIIVKTQGFVNGNIKEGDKEPIKMFQRLLDLYKDIDRDGLRANMKYFLESVTPAAQRYGVNLCVHPDDPPFAVLGLPRIVTSEEDIDWFLNAVDVPNNGLTFCAGSLSAGRHNDVPAMAAKYASRTHFVHLRSTEVAADGNFVEASHLGGRANLIEVIRTFEKTNPALPMRIDHGRLMLDDVNKNFNPGYSFLGRMFALAQIEGVMAVVKNELTSK